MRLVQEELLKYTKRKIIFIAIILLSILNVYNIVHNYADTHSDAYWSIYQEIRGEFTEEKTTFIMNHYNEYQSIVSSGVYETEVPNKKYYTGFVYGDLYEFNTHRDEMERIFSYNDMIKKTKEAAEENVDIYESKGNHYEQLRNKRISTLYKNRNIDSYYDTSGVASYLSYDFSSLLIIMILIFAISPTFTNEKQVGMDVIIQTCKNGAYKTVDAKIYATLVLAIIISSYFYILDFVCFVSVAHLDGLFAPIYQISQYSFSPLNINIIQYCICSVILKISGCCILSMFLLVISSFFSEILFSFSFGTGLTLLFIVFENKNWQFANPISFISHNDLFNSFVTINIFGYPIQEYILTFAFGCMEFIFLCFLLHKTYKSKVSYLAGLKLRKNVGEPKC